MPAARWSIALVVVLGLLTGRGLDIAAAETGPLRVSGDVVHKWRSGTTDLAWAKGNCRLHANGHTYVCESVLLTIDGSAGDLRVGVLMDRVRIGDQAAAREPTVATLRCTEMPILDAPRLRGPADVPADWQRRLGLTLDPVDVPASGRDQNPGHNVIRQVQFTQFGDTQPNINAGTLPPSGLVVPESQTLPPPIRPPLQRSLQPPLTPAPTPFTPVPLPNPADLSSADASPPPPQFFVGGGTRSVEFLPRGPSSNTSIETVDRAATGESVFVVRGGVTVLIRDVSMQLSSGELMELGTVELSADTVVAWVPTIRDILMGNANFSDSDGELYLEGDIVFRQGDRTIYANAMYYNATREIGVILDAEAITSVPQYRGIVRVKAAAMRQIARDNYLASNAAITSSRMGVPRYWLQSNQLQITPRPVAILDPATGQAVVDSEPYLSSGGNFVYLAGVPVFYWPRINTPLRKPTLYLTGAGTRTDDIFGTQVLLEWDLFQLLGFVNRPDGVESTLLTDYLSERGPAIGTRTTYNRTSFFGIPGPATGRYDSYIINDDGLDFLGLGRQGIQPEETIRGRTVLKHRQILGGGWEWMGEIGYLSDRNFAEQFFEGEWDSEADRATGLRLRRYAGSQMVDIGANLQINDFFQETEHLPVIDHYALGGSLLGDSLTWSMHNEVGYQRLNVADAPADPTIAAATSRLPGEIAAEGVVARSRQELSWPIDAGPIRMIPFAIGEASYYGEGVDGQDVTRLWGGGGVRANLPLSRVDPTVQSGLLNIRGLAHKVDLSAEYFYADSDTDLESLPLYDPLSDNAQEEFRRVFAFNLFGSPTVPDRFDPRFVALRNGIQRNVVSASDTVADDLQQIRLGVKNRFQTKRGLPGRERITDLFRFDVETILFPDADRDNFGETIGPSIFDAQYNLGDRVTLLSDGYIDFIDDGLRSISAGVRTSRPGVGDLYVGLLSLEGPISSTVLRANFDQRLNEKWIASAGTTYDFGDVGSVGHSFGLTRIGESFLVQLGVNVDSGRDNTSFGFLVEPRFLPSPRLGRLGGQLIPPTGVDGLE